MLYEKTEGSKEGVTRDKGGMGGEDSPKKQGTEAELIQKRSVERGRTHDYTGSEADAIRPKNQRRKDPRQYRNGR